MLEASIGALWAVVGAYHIERLASLRGGDLEAPPLLPDGGTQCSRAASKRPRRQFGGHAELCGTAKGGNIAMSINGIDINEALIG